MISPVTYRICLGHRLSAFQWLCYAMGRQARLPSLSQAMARLRFSEKVEEADVDEALRLMEESQRTVADVHGNNRIGQREDKRIDHKSAIFQIIT